MPAHTKIGSERVKAILLITAHPPWPGQIAVKRVVVVGGGGEYISQVWWKSRHTEKQNCYSVLHQCHVRHRTVMINNNFTDVRVARVLQQRHKDISRQCNTAGRASLHSATQYYGQLYIHTVRLNTTSTNDTSKSQPVYNNNNNNNNNNSNNNNTNLMYTVHTA